MVVFEWPFVDLHYSLLQCLGRTQSIHNMYFPKIYIYILPFFTHVLYCDLLTCSMCPYIFHIKLLSLFFGCTLTLPEPRHSGISSGCPAKMSDAKLHHRGKKSRRVLHSNSWKMRFLIMFYPFLSTKILHCEGLVVCLQWIQNDVVFRYFL